MSCNPSTDSSGGGSGSPRPVISNAPAWQSHATMSSADATSLRYLQNPDRRASVMPFLVQKNSTQSAATTEAARIERSRGSTVTCLTPELSRTALRPWASETCKNLHEAAKRARLERIVRCHLPATELADHTHQDQAGHGRMRHEGQKVEIALRQAPVPLGK